MNDPTNAPDSQKRIQPHVGRAIFGALIALFAAAVLGREVKNGAPGARIVGLSLVTLGLSISAASQYASANYKNKLGHRFGFFLFTVGFVMVLTIGTE